MEIKKIFFFAATALLIASCSNDDNVKEQETPNGWVSRIGVNAGVDTRITNNGVNVTWAAGDRIGLIKTSDATTNKQFVLSSGIGTNTALFDAVSASDYLDAGTWRAYYPYSQTKYTSTNPL